MDLSENIFNVKNHSSKMDENNTTANEFKLKSLQRKELSANREAKENPLVKKNENQLFTIELTNNDTDGVTDLNPYVNLQISNKVTFGLSPNDILAHEVVTDEGESEYELVTKRSTETSTRESRHSRLYEYLHFSKSVSSADQDDSSRKQVCLTGRMLRKMPLVLSLAAVVTVFIIGAFIGVKLTAVKHGGWSMWEHWSSCSVSCGYGMQNRKRTCSDPEPVSSGLYCAGDSMEYRICYNSSCFGNWTDWIPWGVCSVTCGTGLRKRERNCTTEDVQQSCNGEASEYSICSQTDCSVVNGGWSNWEPWGLCSATCGSGMSRRVRSCSNPTPNNGGNFCFGETSEYRLCNTANCQVIHGGWSLWTSWTPCSSTCAKTRTRSCTKPVPSQDGHMCQGDAEDKETCNLYACVFGRMYVRLVGGSSSLNGRLEVSIDNFNWGTVCDDNFDPSDARVVCRMLGYTSTSAVIDSSAIVDGSGPIYLDDLQCNGSETSLLYCQHIGWGNHNCGHSEDVGVSCS